MDEITRIIDLSRSNEDIISDLKEKFVDVPQWSDLRKQYDPKEHDINKDSKRPKKMVSGKPEEPSRIHLGLEKLATKRMTEFMFAIPVKRVYSNIEDGAEKQEIAKAIEAIYTRARIDSVNLKRGKSFFASCEICTMWYAVEDKNKLYGFDSKYKLKCKSYSPMDGYSLYPLFDEMDDMLAMSFEYKKKIKEEEFIYFETYTKDKHITWRSASAGSFEIVGDEDIKLLKIPAIYTHTSTSLYSELSHIVSEIEFTLSRNSDVIAYNCAPILMVSGEVKGSEAKGEGRRVYRVDNGGSVSYISWAQSIEALKYHVDTLLRMYFMQLQLPDISFENMKGLSAMSGEARKTLLTDAHLKVGDEKCEFLEFFDREANIIKAFLKLMNPKWESAIDEIDIEHVITPFIQCDELGEIEKLSKANGGKALMSQKESIERLGLSNDPKDTLAQIQQEDKTAAQNNSITNLFQNNE